MNLHRFLVMLTLFLALALAVTIWFFPSNEDFRTENPFWNGSKEISFSHQVSPLESLANLPSSPRGSTLIIIPYLEFSPAELEALDSFVTLAGTMVLADAYGYGNQVLRHLGLKGQFSGQTLLDPLANDKNQWFPRIYHFKASSFTSNIDSLVLNHATCLTDVEANDILASSSSFSFLDLNDNQTRDEDEPAGPLPVIHLGESLVDQLIESERSSQRLKGAPTTQQRRPHQRLDR